MAGRSHSPNPPGGPRRSALRQATVRVLAATAWVALGAGAAPAAHGSAFVPLEPGDSAYFQSHRNGERLVSQVDATRRRWVHYTEFAGLGDLWVLANPARDVVYVRTAATSRPRLLVDFGAPVGSRFQIEIPPCNVGVATLAARGQRVITPVGSFDDTVLIELEPSCTGGVARAWFARDVGVVRFERLAERGTVVPYALAAADVGDLRLAPSQGLEVSASFPGPVLDHTETLEARSVCDALDPSDCALRAMPASLEVALTAHNRGAHDLEWQTPTGQLFEITVFDMLGNEVSRWSRGRRISPRRSDHVIPAGETITVQGRIELADDVGRPLPSGSYTLAIEIFGIDVSASSPLDIVDVEQPSLPAASPAPGGAPPAPDAETEPSPVILGRGSAPGSALQPARPNRGPAPRSATGTFPRRSRS